jgi:hypothetical protein
MRLAGAVQAPEQAIGGGTVVERRSLNSELWHACAGPLVGLPAVGSRVVYFPQGHTEQVKQNWFFLFLFFGSFFLFTDFFWSRLRKGVHFWKVSCLHPAIPDEIGVVPPAHPLVWTNC